MIYAQWRAAIDNYIADRQEPPRALDDLVTAGYLRKIPVDAITRKGDSVVELDNVVLGPHAEAYGIADVRSRSGVNGSCAGSRDIWLQ